LKKRESGRENMRRPYLAPRKCPSWAPAIAQIGAPMSRPTIDSSVPTSS
jgi:hypothetical protein